jgi:hypothetical protein
VAVAPHQIRTERGPSICPASGNVPFRAGRTTRASPPSASLPRAAGQTEGTSESIGIGEQRCHARGGAVGAKRAAAVQALHLKELAYCQKNAYKFLTIKTDESGQSN